MIILFILPAGLLIFGGAAEHSGAAVGAGFIVLAIGLAAQWIVGAIEKRATDRQQANPPEIPQ